MIDPTATPAEGADPAGPQPSPIVRVRAILPLSAWCGLTAGWLEVAALVARKSNL